MSVGIEVSGLQRAMGHVDKAKRGMRVDMIYRGRPAKRGMRVDVMYRGRASVHHSRDTNASSAAQFCS